MNSVNENFIYYSYLKLSALLFYFDYNFTLI